ncbi:MAG: HAMP domain-containing protein [Syntrophaceae bacterium]|nr:HAMP domain-containing protein [Syntrophaceae bacterium]
MKLTIFSRVLIGYLILIILVIAMGGYTFYQMVKINEVTQSILTVNNQMLDYSEKLLDLIYSQVRYEKKFIISKDDIFYIEFLRLKNDFDRYLEEMTPLADLSQTSLSLKNIKELFQNYQSLVHEEAEDLKRGYPPSHLPLNQQKEEATQSIISEIEKLKTTIRQNATDKTRLLYKIGMELRQVGMVMTGAFILIGILVSLFIHRSITAPVSILKKKTREIGQGNFQGDLRLTSPPELAELAGAFNLMCNKLNELDKMKSDFLSLVTHELRTPLSSIKMGMDLLRDGVEGPVTEGQKELLTVIEKESDRLIGLVNSILDLSKMEAGMMSFHLRPQPITPLIDQTIKELRPLVDSKKIILERKMTEGLPVVKVDGERILQALRNIIGNAIKFTPEGGRIKVSARTVDHGVEVAIADTGPGIPKENLITIFEKFQQVITDRTGSTQGTGLGLAIAKQIINHHGGKIWAESQLGHGSIFFFFLPA